MRGELLYLACQAFTSESVRAKSLIHQDRIILERDIFHGSDKDKETRGYMMIQVLRDRPDEAIIYIKLGNADADS